ncbi:hypothetical protein JT358_07645 [Micrococcales bacterium 31B]|nr:hypothetical protein [Micrococcales bacterium 31B]
MIKDTLRGVLRLWPVVLLCVVVSGLLGVVVLKSTAATYRADTTLIAESLATVTERGIDLAIDADPNGASDPNGIVSGAYNPSYVPPARMDMDVSAVGQFVSNPAVTQAVKQASGFPGTALELARLASISAPRGTGLLTIQIRYTDPNLVTKIADAYGAELLKQAETLKQQNPDFTTMQRVAVASTAVAAIVPSQSVQVERYLVSGLVAGIVIALAIIYLRNGVRTPGQVRSAYGVPVTAHAGATLAGGVQRLGHVAAQIVGRAPGADAAERSPLAAVTALDKRDRFDRGGANHPHALAVELAAELAEMGFAVELRDATGGAVDAFPTSLPERVTLLKADPEQPLAGWNRQPGIATLVVAADPRRSAAAAKVTAAEGSLVLSARVRADGMRALRDAITVGCTDSSDLAAIHLAPERGTA